MNEQTIARLTAVINTLNGATLRADQLDAIQRISVCVTELKSMIMEAANKTEETKEE